MWPADGVYVYGSDVRRRSIRRRNDGSGAGPEELLRWRRSRRQLHRLRELVTPQLPLLYGKARHERSATTLPGRELRRWRSRPASGDALRSIGCL